jgi:CheY-like chemotaxis protein
LANLSHLNRVLVVEDEGLILLDIAQTLADAGVTDLVTTTSLEEAFASLDGLRFDAALLDLHLGRHGWSYDIATQLRARGVPFVFITGSGEVVEGFRDIPLVMKPFAANEIIEALLTATADRQTVAAE